MTIIVKYSDTKNNETRYHLASDPGEAESIKNHYIRNEIYSSESGHNLIEFIYPEHTERVKLYELEYRKHS